MGIRPKTKVCNTSRTKYHHGQARPRPASPYSSALEPNKRKIEIESPKAQKTPCSGQPTGCLQQHFLCTMVRKSASSQSMCRKRKEPWQPAPTQRHTAASMKHNQATISKSAPIFCPRLQRHHTARNLPMQLSSKQQQQGSKGKHSISSSIYQGWLIHLGQSKLLQQ
ncbi:hypothetical protein Nepgr_024802 [Nepenthes gracilis]|uniref:Uncharacterized protein n=1 Tax=Nepenthes gracilis TaxID=150966 RepID=A0AAD3T539_NEPGR|nr:hypothetical protein Nepgr_024802 [Nepenthes gracilis]